MALLSSFIKENSVYLHKQIYTYYKRQNLFIRNNVVAYKKVLKYALYIWSFLRCRLHVVSYT